MAFILSTFYVNPSIALCPAEGDVRLVGGATNNEGRVEVYHNGQWGTVCDDLWDIDDAMVVCRQLNFDFAVSAHGTSTFGAGTGPIHYDNVNCNGTEERLADCPHNGIGIHNCVHFEDAGVVCGCKSFLVSRLLNCSHGGTINQIYMSSFNPDSIMQDVVLHRQTFSSISAAV